MYVHMYVHMYGYMHTFPEQEPRNEHAALIFLISVPHGHHMY